MGRTGPSRVLTTRGGAPHTPMWVSLGYSHTRLAYLPLVGHEKWPVRFSTNAGPVLANPAPSVHPGLVVEHFPCAFSTNSAPYLPTPFLWKGLVVQLRPGVASCTFTAPSPNPCWALDELSLDLAIFCLRTCVDVPCSDRHTPRRRYVHWQGCHSPIHD